MKTNMNAQIEIKHWAGRVLYTHQPVDSSEMTMRHALEAATVTGANLTGANLTGANLTGANLTGANLRGANLTDAYLTGATIYGVKITRAPVIIDGLRWGVTIINGHIKIGCQFHGIGAWSAFDDAAIAAMDGRDALRFWREHKAVIMALAASFAAMPVGEVPA